MHEALEFLPSQVLYTCFFSRSPYFRGFRGWPSVRENNMTTVLKALSYNIRENKNPRIVKIVQTRKLGGREKKWVGLYSSAFYVQKKTGYCLVKIIAGLNTS